jgi:beta-propeller repeat-containing protein
MAVNTGSAADAPPPTVTVYSATASGSAVPLRTLQLTNVGSTSVSDIAADAAGNIYVTGYVIGAGSVIAVYSPTANGPATPMRTITFGETANVYGVAVDAAGDVFANVCPSGCTDTDFVIEEFAPGASGAATPVNTINVLNVSVTSLTRGLRGGPVRLDGVGNIFTSLTLISEPGANVANVIYGFGPTTTGSATPTVQITLVDPNGWFAVN